jgi:hypothetical protein
MEKIKYSTFKDRYNNMLGYKEEYLKKYNSKRICECGLEVAGLSVSKHLKSKKHAQIMKIVNSLKTHNNF